VASFLICPGALGLPALAGCASASTESAAIPAIRASLTLLETSVPSSFVGRVPGALNTARRVFHTVRQRRSKMEFRGVIPAVATPFTDDLALDLPGLVANIERLAGAGIDAVVVTGTMGEATALSDDERGAVIQAALGVLANVAVGISSASTTTSIGF